MIGKAMIGKRIKFKVSHNMKYEGTFLGIGKKKGTHIIGLLFGDVREVGIEILSIMMIHPDNITTTNIKFKTFIDATRELFRNHNCSKSKNIYYPSYQIAMVNLPHSTPKITQMIA